MACQLDNRPGDQDKNDSVLLDNVHIDPHLPSPPVTSSNVIPLHVGQMPGMKAKAWEPPKEVLWLGHPMAILALMMDSHSSTVENAANANPVQADQEAGWEWEPPKEVIWLGHRTDVLALCQEIETCPGAA